MADELKEIIDSVRTRLQAELDSQLNALKERHQQALAEARRHAEAEARKAAEAEVEQALAARTHVIREEARRAPRRPWLRSVKRRSAGPRRP